MLFTRRFSCFQDSFLIILYRYFEGSFYDQKHLDSISLQSSLNATRKIFALLRLHSASQIYAKQRFILDDKSLSLGQILRGKGSEFFELCEELDSKLGGFYF